ncbi:hypothetical protein ACHZ98_24275 [Streptomyces sp. MAR4 CNY-716]
MAGLTEAEEERLRKALGVIAAESAVADAGAVREEAAAGEEGEGGWAEPPGRAPGARRVRRARRARRAVAMALSAATVAAFCFLAYTAIGGAETDRTAKDGAQSAADADGRGLTLLENAACTKRLLEGTVADVEQVPHPPDAFPWVKVTLTDVRWHVPPSAESRVTVRIPDPEEWNDEKPFARGEQLLVEDLGQETITYYRRVPGNPMPDLETARDERLRAMNKAQEKGVRCPSFWVNRQEGPSPPARSVS